MSWNNGGLFLSFTYGQRHAKRDLRTYAKSTDPDQPPRLRRCVWSGSVLFDNQNINGTYFSCYVNNFIMYRCFKHRIGADLDLHYVKCPKVPFRVTLAIYVIFEKVFQLIPTFAPKWHWTWPLIYFTENLSLGYNLWAIEHRTLIFHMCLPYDKTFPTIPKYLTLWPWSRPLTYFLKNILNCL